MDDRGGGFVSVYCDKIKIICTGGYYKGKIIKSFPTRIASICTGEQSWMWGYKRVGTACNLNPVLSIPWFCSRPRVCASLGLTSGVGPFS